MGVFIALSPFWGFHNGLAIAVAYLFRLNKVITIIFTNISIPPLIPLIVYGGHEFGALLMGESGIHLSFTREINYETIAGSALQFFIGSLMLAFIVSALLGLSTFAYLKYRQSKVKKF